MNRCGAVRTSGVAPLSVLTRVDQLGRAVVVAALAAVVAVLIRRLALRARAVDEPVGQERAGLRVVELLDVLLLHEPGLADRLPRISSHSARFSGLCVLP